jgi:hypothetical protein
MGRRMGLPSGQAAYPEIRPINWHGWLAPFQQAFPHWSAVIPQLPLLG